MSSSSSSSVNEEDVKNDKEEVVNPNEESSNKKEQDTEDVSNELLARVEKLSVSTSIHSKEEAPETLRRISSWISDAKCQRILVLSGAGVSVAAGIPDFRTPGTGLYDNLQKYHLPYPEAIFDLDFYQRNPAPFCSLAKEIWPGIRYSPTLTHSFVALLAQRGLLLRNYSQNIDGLEYIAGIPAEQILECHGHFRTASCIRCDEPADGEHVKQVILESDDYPICKECGDYVKPDIVFFGEGLPDRFHSLLQKDLYEADLLLIMGTSLMVAPVSMIPDMVPKRCKRVLLNRERVGSLNVSNKQRDVFHAGDCDDSVRILAKLLGWEEDLVQLNESTRIAPQAVSESKGNESS